MNINTPLATFFRPKSLKEFIGQEKIINSNSWLYQAIKSDKVPSLILWGPPGSGKTTLAFIVAKETKAEFVELSATTSGVKDLKQIIERAKESRRLGQNTILFIDEIHRWNKAQQDALLPQVENGVIILIGATTENPSFSINNALLSRVKLVVLEALTSDDLIKIIKSTAKILKVKIHTDVIGLIAKLASGDARRALGILESAAQYHGEISAQLIKDIISKPNLLYDKNGDEHYNLISALHKSMRGSNADAAVYYLGRMIEAGEDPLYIARRLVRFASEDVGLANNSALMLLTSIYDACRQIGLPECAVNLAHGVIYLAKSPKSIVAYQAYNKVKAEISQTGSLPVPIHLRNAPTKLMTDLGYGKNYKYSPLEDDTGQDYLPEKIRTKNFL